MKIKHIILVGLLSASVMSCNKKLDINVDPNNPIEATEDLLLPGILSNFSYEVIGGFPVRTTTLWTKHLAQSVPGPHEGQYRLTANDVNNFWSSFSYVDVMKNCRVLIDLATENENFNYSAIAKIILAWNMSMITDSFGDAPFSDAFKGADYVIKPIYDSQESIYQQIQVLLDEAIDEAGREIGEIPGKEDFVYEGSMESWQALARTLKARFYLRLSFAPGYDAIAQADLALQALSDGALSDKDAPSFPYFAETGAENPWYQFAIDGKWDNRNRPSQYYVMFLESMNDPRLAYQVAKVDTGTNAGKYVGITNDPTPRNVGNYSAIHPFYSAADAPLYWFIPAEVSFIEAEAEFLKAGRTVNQAVRDAYIAGISSSMEFYGIDNFEDYLVENALSTNADEAYEQIMTQKYIANYLQFESYNDYRRTGYPELPINTDVYPGVPLEIEPEIDIIPLRMPYPSSERQYNAENIPSNIPAGYQQAMVIPVWWDND